MATETWPLILPSTAYSIEPENEVLETQYETGEPLQRLRFDKHFENVSVTWLLSDYEYLIFKNWFALNIARGTKKFNVDLVLGDDIQNYEAQWISGGRPYQVSYQQVLYWNVSATLRIQDTEELDEGILDVLIGELPDGPEDLILSIQSLDDYIEITLPNAFG